MKIQFQIRHYSNEERKYNLNFSLYIAKRYAFIRSKNSAINIITFIASFGIIAASLALFVVLSVFSGLREFSLSFSNNTDPDIKIEAKTGKSFYVNEFQEKKITSSKLFSSFSKIVEEKAFFIYDNKEHVGYIKGVDKHFIEVTNIENKLYQGFWFENKTTQVVVGSEIARKLSIGLLDFNNNLEVYIPKAGKGSINQVDDAFNTEVLNTIGVFNINEEIDNKFVFCDIELAQNLLMLNPNQLTHIEFKLNPKTTDEQAKTFLNELFQNKVVVKNRIQLNDSLYKMLNTENIVLYLIFTLVLIIALFNLIGAIIMMIIDKKKNLKTFLNLGLELKSIRNVFFYQGIIMSVFGGLIGIILGILIIQIQYHFELIMITNTLAYPVIFEFKNVLLVFLTILVLGIISSWIASNTVSKKLVE